MQMLRKMYAKKYAISRSITPMIYNMLDGKERNSLSLLHISC